MHAALRCAAADFEQVMRHLSLEPDEGRLLIIKACSVLAKLPGSGYIPMEVGAGHNQLCSSSPLHHMCVCTCVCACVRACVRACVTRARGQSAHF